MYKPGLADSAITVDTDSPEYKAANEAAKSVGGWEQQAKNSGYIFGTPTTDTVAGGSKTSSIPALDNTSIVQRPGEQNQSVINDLKKQSNNFKTMLDETGDNMKKNTDEILARGTYADTPEGKAAFEEQQRKGKTAGTITSDDQMRIDQAGDVQKQQYDILIRNAQEKGRQGRASNLVAAAKSGGLDSTAWTGISALVGVQAGGPEGFEGIGGKLAAMGSEYDSVVLDLQGKQAQAVAAAKMAERQAILTEKAADWERTTKLWEQANNLYNDKTTMLMNKEKVLQSYTDYLKTSMEDANNEIKKMAQLGVDFSTLQPETIADIENRAGLNPGSLATMYKTYQDKAVKEATDELVKRGKDLMAIAKDLPPGEEYTIPGTEIKVKGFKTSGKVSEIEMVVGNKVYKVGLDEQTGKELWRVDTGKPYRTGDKGKTITWEMAKDLGDLSLYGKPVTAIPEGATITTKDEQAFDKEAADIREKLALDQISWADAYNSLKAKYQVPNKEETKGVDILDSILDKDKHYSKTGAKAKKTGGMVTVQPNGTLSVSGN